MHKHLFTLAILCFTSILFGQQKSEPTILILAPNETSYDKSFKKEISKYNKNVSQNQNEKEVELYLASEDFLSQSENIKQMLKSEMEFSKNTNFFKNASFISEQFLAYKFFEKFPNLLFKLKDQTSTGSLEQLKDLSTKEHLQYVLNFSKIELYKQDNIGYAKINIQLYDSISNSLILNKSYIGDWTNPGFTFACTNESINCTINNALSKGLNEIIYTIALNSPTLKKEKQLREERFNVLSNKHLNQDYDKQFLKTIITDSTINLNNSYQLLHNDNRTKFVAFFIEQVSSQNLKSLTKNKKDQNVKIISPNDIKDKALLEEIPRTYAFIVNGVKYQGNWYYEKSKVTYFQAKSLKEGQEQYFNNLQKWNFFKEKSIELNPEFWETNLFKKVRDLKKDPEWEEYGESIWKTDEINNREYIGLYEIIVNSLRRENNEKKITFENKIKKENFEPNYQKLKEKYPNEYSKMSEHSLISSKERKLAINPVLVTNKKGKQIIHYFVAFDNSKELYEWVYFKPHIVEGGLFGSEVVDKISTLTEWNFSVDNLNDENFWNKYVLLKQGDNFKYLKRVKE
tara:strand:+ start:76 stop:1788 length:1713 start_codon:yes stop_codon:yes gene_type:complete